MRNRQMFAALILLLLVPSVALACFFDFLPTSELYEKADAVFVGKVIESPWKQLPDRVVSTGRTTYVVRFAIERPLRGIQAKELTFRALVPCAYVFLEGETYLVHA